MLNTIKRAFEILPLYDDIFSIYLGKISENLFKIIESDLEWIGNCCDQMSIFNEKFRRGNRVNTEDETRWSLICHFKAEFLPF